MIVVTDEDGTYMYDLSIEEDDVEDNNGGNGGETTDAGVRDEEGDCPLL